MEDYIKFFAQRTYAWLELRTKSVSITPLIAYAKKNKTPQNVIIAYSLAPRKAIERYEDKTPSLKARLSAIKKLIVAGYIIALHLDPIIYEEDDAWEKSYEELLKKSEKYQTL